MRRLRGALAIAALSSLVLGAAGFDAGCGKKSASSSEGTNYKDITNSFDDSEPPPAQRKPVEGAQLGELSDAERGRFERLVDSLPSPCGKAHSLRTSRNTDASCVVSRFAVNYVVQLLGDGATDDEIKELYEQHYMKKKEKHDFKLADGVPHLGPTDARVVLVEFFDFGCPHCQEFAPVLEQVAAAYPTDVVIYFKEFPLSSHTQSKGAAQAALAANKQGKFLDYYKLLFANQGAQGKDDLDKYARQLGLDMTKFEADMQAAAPEVEAEKSEGEAVGVEGTPTLYINGRQYDDPNMLKYLKMRIDEELALNR